MQRDKSLIALSAGGVGLLVTLLTTVGIGSPFEIIFYGMGILGFLGCIISTLCIFERNKVQLERSINRKPGADQYLLRLEKRADILFYIGLSFSIGLGIYNGFTSYQQLKGEQKMSKDRITTAPLKKGLSGTERVRPPKQGTQQSGKHQWRRHPIKLNK